MARLSDTMSRRRRAAGCAAAAFLLAIGAVGDSRAQSSICRDTGAFCSRSLASSCLTKFGAGAREVDGSKLSEACETQLKQYRECLSLVTAQCPRLGALASTLGERTPQRGGDGTATALQVWNEIKAVEDADVMEAFAKAYPGSPLAVLASKRAAGLRGAARAGVPAPVASSEPSREELAAQEQDKRLRRAFAEGQRQLNRLGYNAGPVDGDWGARSGDALVRFLADFGYPPSRMLTPDALVALQETPTGAPKKIAPAAVAEARSPAAKQATPKAKSGSQLAKIVVTFRYRDRTKKECSLRRRVLSRSLNLSRARLRCRGRGDAFLTLKTNASGRAQLAKAELNGDVVSLNGSSWRYNGLRSAGLNPNELRGAKIVVSF